VNQVLTSRFIHRAGAAQAVLPVVDHYIAPGRPPQHEDFTDLAGQLIFGCDNKCATRPLRAESIWPKITCRDN
jgi:hypothetical protein